MVFRVVWHFISFYFTYFSSIDVINNKMSYLKWLVTTNVNPDTKLIQNVNVQMVEETPILHRSSAIKAWN